MERRRFAARGATRRRHRIHDGEIFRRLHQRFAGWPAIFSLNMPSGPSPPLAALGARIRANVSDNFTLVAAVFDGGAAGPGSGDPQLRDPNGVNFRVNDPPLVMGEVQYIWTERRAILASPEN